jgi:hypothetical protein
VGKRSEAGHDGAGEGEPGRFAVVGVVNDPLGAGIDETENRAGEVGRKRRPAALVGDDP